MFESSIGITVDCAEAEVAVLADFWAAALGYEKSLPFLLVDPGGVRPRLVFQPLPEPKVGKNRWHLDLYVEHLDGLDTEVARLRARSVRGSPR